MPLESIGVFSNMRIGELEGVAAKRTAGIGPGAGARHIEGGGTSPASSASRFAVERSPTLMLAPLAIAPAQSRASRPITQPASVPAQRRGTSRGSRPIAGLDAGAARHRAGIEGLAAERATGIGPGAAARHRAPRRA